MLLSNLTTMAQIDISHYLKKLEDTGDPVNNLISVSLSLAEDIKIELNKIEKIKTKNVQIPIFEVYINSTEISVWSIAVLASAWSTWCFTARE